MSFNEFVRWYAEELRTLHSEPYISSVVWKDYKDALESAATQKIRQLVIEALSDPNP